MRAIRAIAVNTFREAIRDRILYLFVGFAVAMVLSTKLFGLLTVGDEAKIVKDVGLASMQFFSMLIAVMMSMLLISREVDSRTVFNIISKPVARWKFIVGKYLGLVSVVAANLLFIATVLVVMVLVYTKQFDPMLVFAAAMTMLEMMVLAAFATLFAVVTRPILGSLLTLAVFVVGQTSEDLWMLTRQLPGELTRVVIAAIYYLTPNLQRFNFRNEVVHGLPVNATAVALAVVYAFAFVTVTLILASLRFRHRDLR
ncbi:MAG: ABC transporter permease [Holophagae bacterium]|jgi:ABC-type transport system involved in multi-copper enzyme maturation permease subunit